MRKISAVGLFCCGKFEETPKQKVIDLSKFKIFYFRPKCPFKSTSFSDGCTSSSSWKTTHVKFSNPVFYSNLRYFHSNTSQTSWSQGYSSCCHFSYYSKWQTFTPIPYTTGKLREDRGSGGGAPRFRIWGMELLNFQEYARSFSRITTKILG